MNINTDTLKKYLLPNLPYLLFVLVFANLGEAVRLAPGADAPAKFLGLSDGFSMAFQSLWPGAAVDWLVGICGAALIRLIVYLKGKDAKKYRKNVEYGSARWGNKTDIAPFMDPKPENNIILTQTEGLMLSGRPKNPAHARNKDAIDKDAVVESIYGGLHGKADTFFSSDLPYCDVEQATTTFDIDAANKLLDEAGYTDSDGDGIREKDGTKISADFLYQTGSASDDNLAVYICDQAKKIGIELTPNSAVMMDWYAMVQGGQYGLTIFKTQGGFYDPANVVTNINPQTSMDPILMLIGTTKPEMAELVSELDASTDETRIQEIYNTILTTIADENLTTPLVYMHQLAIYSDKVKDYTFPMDSNFTSIQNIKVK